MTNTGMARHSSLGLLFRIYKDLVMSEDQNTGRDQNRWIVLLAAVLILCLGFLAHQLILLNGHDYGLALTRLLDTHFAVIKQGVGLYEYSPAFCGGIGARGGGR